jgi:hypothetical protein
MQETGVPGLRAEEGEGESQPNVMSFLNQSLVICPVCFERFISFAWNLVGVINGVSLYDVSAKCHTCKMWFVIGYRREK